MALMKIDNITKRFGGLVALRNVSFSIEKGEILGLIGPNGAGKTTLVNIMTGFLKPENGRILYKGADLTKLSPDKICHLGVSRTFQIIRYFPRLTALENVVVGALFGRGERTSDEEARKKAADVLEYIGFPKSLWGVPARNLNVVQLKLTTLARALATDPEVILLDEVLCGLNPTEMEEMTELIKRLRDEKGITFMMIEHVMRAIMRTCDRVVVLSFGEKIAEGIPEKVTHDENVIKAYLGERFEMLR